MGQPGGGRLRVVEHELAGDGAALLLVRVIDAVDPVVGPLGLFPLGLFECILPERGGVLLPGRRHGGVAGRGRQRIEIGLGGNLGVGQRVAIDKDRADDLVPFFAGGDVAACAPGVVARAPVIEDGRLHVADQFQLRGPAAQVFGAWVDEKQADVLLGAGEAVGRNLVLHGAVAVLVLD